MLDESGLCCGLTVPPAVLCCGVKPMPWTQKGGAPSLDRPVFFSECDSSYGFVPPHYPVTASFCFSFDLRLPDFHSKNVFVFYHVVVIYQRQVISVV